MGLLMLSVETEWSQFIFNKHKNDEGSVTIMETTKIEMIGNVENTGVCIKVRLKGSIRTTFVTKWYSMR